MAKKKTGQKEQLFELHEPVQAMPDGYYSGDKPNPNLRKFIGDHATPYDPNTDDYNVTAFDKAITTTKANAIYNMHTYWSKKPHEAIRQYVQHYTKQGDIVFDPFCGSGGTALAALMDSRKAIAIDRSPAATFITRNYCTPVEPAKLQRDFEEVKLATQSEMDWLYETRCDRCNGKATTSYTVYSQVFQCPRCLNKVPLFDCIEAQGTTQAGKPKAINICPICQKKGQQEEIKSQSEKFGSIPVQVSYLCQSGCKPARGHRLHNDIDEHKREFFDKYDLGKLKEIEAKSIPYWYPKGYDMTSFSRYQRDALWLYGVSEVSDLFTKRNLWALALFRHQVGSLKHDDLMVLLTWASMKCSRMMRFCEDGIGRILTGTYYIPQISRDSNVPSYLKEAFGDVLAHHTAKRSVLNRQTPTVLISTQSSVRMDEVPANSVDYIFTDPPYADKEQYGELNYVWEAWLGLDTSWHQEEIIVNEVRGKSEGDWARMLKEVFSECYRIIKPGHWLSLCYHDTSEGTWALIQDVLAEVGFVVDKSESAIFIDTSQRTHNQIHADKSTKRDLVLNFRKPKSLQFKVTKVYGSEHLTESNKDLGIATFLDYASQIVRDFLTKRPGATKDRVYDEVVSQLVSSRSMEAHGFDALLRSVADEVQEPVKKNLFENEEPNLFGTHVQSRWYLKETADLIDQAEQAKEDAVARRLETYIADYLSKRPEDEGVHYSDLFEQFLPVHDKPRRLLGDWLPEYFVKTASGTWRVPNQDESKQLEVLRVQGTLRRIKRFANALIEGVPIRDKDRPASDSDSLDWLRQCRRAGLYEQGKAIYEKGGLNSANLTDEQQIEAEDDYRICARRGSDETGKPKTKKRKPKEEA